LGERRDQRKFAEIRGGKNDLSKQQQEKEKEKMREHGPERKLLFETKPGARKQYARDGV